MKRRFNVFVSSVQKELEPARAALKAFLLGDAMLKRFVADVFLFEDLPASDRRVGEVYLAEVERCDLYLGIFGYEYGWKTPRASHPPNASTTTRPNIARPASSTCGAPTILDVIPRWRN